MLILQIVGRVFRSFHQFLVVIVEGSSCHSRIMSSSQNRCHASALSRFPKDRESMPASWPNPLRLSMIASSWSRFFRLLSICARLAHHISSLSYRTLHFEVPICSVRSTLNHVPPASSSCSVSPLSFSVRKSYTLSFAAATPRLPGLGCTITRMCLPYRHG